MFAEPSTSEHVITTSEVCEVCPSFASFRCSRCKSVHYCSKGHQKKDWLRHKPRCNALSKTSDPITEDNRVNIARHTLGWAVDRLFNAIRDDVLPDYDVCEVFGMPKNNRPMQQAIFSCYQSAAKRFDISKAQFVDAHMTDTMNELILGIPQIRTSTYGLKVVGAGGIHLERFPGIP